ncbi:hypothetical protein [Geothrix sp. PMB-07]|nr:hypothetical protein [Geothrix sp. PMB-07]WLT31357.1 hypothetical protein Q9293_16720 [Geothrix sp. PMB-07]
MTEVPSHPRSAAPPARRVDRWVLQIWIVAIGAALLWALLR